jgi:DNA-binding NtrC family response regulator
VDVLIIDDDADLARTLSDLLQLQGNTVRVAFNGEEGLSAIAAHAPDVLVLDIEMPVLDGPSTAYQLLVQDAGRELIPIVLSSGYDDIDRVAARIGTPYRVKKPCSLEALESTLERASREKRAPAPPESFRPSSESQR